jgi:hypothetical protein
MNSAFAVYQEIKVDTNSAIMYNRYECITPQKNKRIYNIKNLARGTTKGVLSDKNSKRIKEMVVNLHTAVNRKMLNYCMDRERKIKPLSFITLTLSQLQKDDDKYIKRHMLDRFLITLQRKGILKQYIWKAETQQNGNLHFHVITPNYITKEVIRYTWNEIQFDNGYLEMYIQKHGHGNAPSTEIKASKNIRHTAGYVAKYIAKKEGSRLIQGRLWGCSDRLRSLRTPKVIVDNVMQKALRKAVYTGKLIVKELEHCDIYIGDIYKFMHTECPHMQKWYISEVERNWNNIIEDIEQKFAYAENNSTFECAQTNVQLKLWQNK